VKFKPDQAYVPPPAALNVAFGVLQEMLEVVAVAVGSTLSSVTFTVPELVQAPDFVTVTLYPPPTETEGVAAVEVKLLGPFQEKVFPVAFATAPNDMVGLIQFIVPPVIAIVGAAPCWSVCNDQRIRTNT
jgi:hypothetical protein